MARWVDTLYAYDIASNTWSDRLAPMPQALNFPGFGVIDGKLYIAGGYAARCRLFGHVVHLRHRHRQLDYSTVAHCHRLWHGLAAQSLRNGEAVSVWRQVSRFDADQHYPDLRPGQ